MLPISNSTSGTSWEPRRSARTTLLRSWTQPSSASLTKQSRRRVLVISKWRQKSSRWTTQSFKRQSSRLTSNEQKWSTSVDSSTRSTIWSAWTSTQSITWPSSSTQTTRASSLSVVSSLPSTTRQWVPRSARPLTISGPDERTKSKPNQTTCHQNKHHWKQREVTI